MDFLVVAPAKMDDSRMANHDPGNERLEKSGEGQGVPAGVAPVSMRMCNVKLRAQRCWE